MSPHDIIIVVSAIDRNIASPTELARGRNHYGIALRGIEIRRRRIAGDKQCQLKKIAAIQREVFNLEIAYHSINHCGSFVYQFIVEPIIQSYRFLYRHCHRHFKIECLSDLEVNAGNCLLSKSFGADLHFINTRSQVGYRKESVAITGGLAFDPGRFLRHGYLSSGHQRTD